MKNPTGRFITYNITTTNNGYSALGDDYITVEHAARAIHERLKELNAQPE